jgi:hypothetical protein
MVLDKACFLGKKQRGSLHVRSFSLKNIETYTDNTILDGKIFFRQRLEVGWCGGRGLDL